MGFSYRKSLGVGPFRLNFSKSGIGVSAGVPGFRVTQNSTGRTYTTFNVPGSGLSYRTPSSKPSAQGCLLILVALLGLAAGGVWLTTST